MNAKETLQKVAEELRKIAQVQEVKKLQKCAQIMLGAAGLQMLSSKIRGK